MIALSDYFGKDTPKLGFGLMRLPKKDDVTDIEQTKEMVDMFLDAGFTYFDTAYVYGTSEADTKIALVDRHPRDSYTLATKLNVNMMSHDEKSAKQQFFTSLERTGAGYFDYYLLHAVSAKNRGTFDSYGIWDFVKEQKEKGLIKHVGFSFHDSPEVLDSVLNEHPEVDFVQLQLNYADWENPKVMSRANYETARAHGVSIVVMEPVKGGTLADPPEEIKKLFKDYNPDASYASWAIRFVASLDGILTVLSGMSNTEQMRDNLSYMKDFKPLNDEEQAIIREAQKILDKLSAIPCTSCRYCTGGCPKKIAIPDIFAAANKRLGGQTDEAAKDYEKAAPEYRRASDCVRCGQCERVCPQHIKIIDNLAKCADMFE